MKRLISMTIALMMLFGCIWASADPPVVKDGIANITITAGNIDANAVSTSEDQATGVQITNSDNVTVHIGDISVEGSHMAIGVYTEEDNQSVNIETGAITVVSNNGSITETGDGEEHEVDDIANAVNNFGGNVTVDGDVSASGKQATGVITTSGEIKVDGEITVKSISGSAAGITAGDGPERNVSTTIEVDKGIDVSGSSSATAIGINIFNKDDQAAVTVQRDAQAVVTGSVESSEDSVVSARGIDVVNFGGNVATVEVEGNLTADGGQMTEGIVVGHHDEYVEHAGTTSVEVGGSITAKNGQDSTRGIVVDNLINTIDITVGQGIIAEGKENVTGIDVNNASGTVVITIEDNGISADGEQNVTGVEVNNVAGKVDIFVAGNVTAAEPEGNSIGIHISDWQDESQEQITGKPENDVAVTGDVAGWNYGLLLGTEDSASTEVLIDGTLSGEQSSIVLTNEENIGDLTITVWKVELNEDGHVAEVWGDGESEDAWEETEEEVSEEIEDTSDSEVEEVNSEEEAPLEVERIIQYIIRLDTQPADGGTFSAGGTTTYTNHGNEYEVAHEGDKVWVQLSLQEGYELESAYNNGEQLLLQDSEGNYYLNVPRGGGVLLSVKLRKKETTTPVAEPAVENTSGQNEDNAAVETVTVDAGTNNPAAPVIVVVAEPNPELELMNDIQTLLKLDDERISTNVAIIRDPETSERTVRISPNEYFMGGTLSLDLDLEILERMAAQRVFTIEVSTKDGNHQVLLPTDELMRVVWNGETFHFEMEEILNSADSETVLQMESRYSILMPATIVRLNIEDPEGNIYEAESVDAILHIREPADQDANFRFAGENGTDTAASAVWNQTAGYWEMPFVGNGCYFAVMP